LNWQTAFGRARPNAQQTQCWIHVSARGRELIAAIQCLQAERSAHRQAGRSTSCEMGTRQADKGACPKTKAGPDDRAKRGLREDHSALELHSVSRGWTSATRPRGETAAASAKDHQRRYQNSAIPLRFRFLTNLVGTQTDATLRHPSFNIQLIPFCRDWDSLGLLRATSSEVWPQVLVNVSGIRS